MNSDFRVYLKRLTTMVKNLMACTLTSSWYRKNCPKFSFQNYININLTKSLHQSLSEAIL